MADTTPASIKAIRHVETAHAVAGQLRRATEAAGTHIINCALQEAARIDQVDHTKLGLNIAHGEWTTPDDAKHGND